MNSSPLPPVITSVAGSVIARTAPLSDRAAHDAAEALGQQWFGPSFDESRFDAWAERIVHLLFVAEDARTGAFLGYADQLFLSPATEQAMRNGTTTEDAFDEHSVLDDAELLRLPAGSRVALYLAGMCVTAPGTTAGREAAMALRACRRMLVAGWRARGLQIVLLMAAATDAGHRVATRAGGRLISAAAARADGYDLFELTDIPDERARRS
jgi:hypothetical protein